MLFHCLLQFSRPAQWSSDGASSGDGNCGGQQRSINSYHYISDQSFKYVTHISFLLFASAVVTARDNASSEHGWHLPSESVPDDTFFRDIMDDIIDGRHGWYLWRAVWMIHKLGDGMDDTFGGGWYGWYLQRGMAWMIQYLWRVRDVVI